MIESLRGYGNWQSAKVNVFCPPCRKQPFPSPGACGSINGMDQAFRLREVMA